MNKKLLIDLVGFLLIALVVLVGYKMSPLLLPQADITVNVPAGCDLQQQACTIALPDGAQLTVDVGQRPIPLVKPFRWQVRVNGLSVQQVQVDFAGVDMDMGYNRPVLAETAPGVFSADVTLPICVTGSMNWQATLMLATPSRRVAVPLRFVTG